MKIAIVGMADFNEEIPDEYEIWVIAGYIGHFKNAARAFECHDYEQTDNYSTWRSFVDDPWCDFYVPEHLAENYPAANLIPTKFLGERFSPSFGSTISYMIAQAVYEMPYEKVKEIVLFGVDMAMEDKYYTQRPSAYYWLGVANALGIKTSGMMIEETYGLKENL